MALSYEAVGVDTEGVDNGLRRLAEWVNATFAFNPARPLLPLGYYANVLPVSPELGLAISTDGVGTKMLVAQQMERYDTVGIDCIAMNANDIICVGAGRSSMVDYIAVEQRRPRRARGDRQGLHDGAAPGGHQHPGRRDRASARDDPRRARRLRLRSRRHLRRHRAPPTHADRRRTSPRRRRSSASPSSGMHSNGFTLARRAAARARRPAPRRPRRRARTHARRGAARADRDLRRGRRWR